MGATERFVAILAGIAFLVSGTTLLYRLNESALVLVPRAGGVHAEGIVGSPRLVNPVLAASAADRDLVALTYAGLMTYDETGKLTPALAEGYTVSEDGRTYTFTLRENATFHDGTQVSAEDVVFTIETVQNPAVKSPLFVNWEGVEVSAPDARTVVFTVPSVYAPFLENTTVGILPRHIWQSLSAEEFPHSEFNTTPIGAGPFMFRRIVRDSSGIPTLYELRSFEDYTLGAPHIDLFQVHLFRNTEELVRAFDEGDIDAVPALSTHILATHPFPEGTVIERAPLLRVFAVFYNHNRAAVLLQDEVRSALDRAAPRTRIVEETLNGYGAVLGGPLPLDSSSASSTDTLETDVAAARTLLEEKGWIRNEEGVYVRETKDDTQELAFSLATANTPELLQAAQEVVSAWTALGARVELKVFEPTDLTQNVIRPRRFDALLFGLVMGHEPDLYAFWHSSQRNDPGLNIAQYADIESDTLLERARAELDPAARSQSTEQAAERIRAAHPASFLYAPEFVYVTNGHTKHIHLGTIVDSSDRFLDVHTWYTRTDRVWPFVRDLVE